MTTDTGVPRTRLGVLPVAALTLAPVLVLAGLGQHRWYVIGLGLVGVALLAAATWTAHRLRTNFEDDITERRTVAVWLGDAGTRRWYLGLVATAYLSFAGLALLVPWTALALVTALLLALPGWQVGSGAISGQLDPVVRDTALVTCYAGALICFGLLLSQG
ncbi:MAG: hypothetical protein ACRDUA_13900 [Micromonosporaceae bacterium]